AAVEAGARRHEALDERAEPVAVPLFPLDVTASHAVHVGLQGRGELDVELPNDDRGLRDGHRDGGHRNPPTLFSCIENVRTPAPLRSGATMMWSRSDRPSTFAASMTRSVSTRSSWLGEGSPLGWLCASAIAETPATIAGRK